VSLLARVHLLKGLGVPHPEHVPSNSDLRIELVQIAKRERVRNLDDLLAAIKYLQ
jgi:hypothetical protein